MIITLDYYFLIFFNHFIFLSLALLLILFWLYLDLFSRFQFHRLSAIILTLSIIALFFGYFWVLSIGPKVKLIGIIINSLLNLWIYLSNILTNRTTNLCQITILILIIKNYLTNTIQANIMVARETKNSLWNSFTLITFSLFIWNIFILFLLISWL